MITTVHQTQESILQAVHDLYLRQWWHADLTYGSGGFWRKLPKPEIRVDLLSTGNVIADLRSLPFRPGSLRSVILDPPFVHAHGKDSVIGRRFSSYKSQKALREMYDLALQEIFQALEPGGVLLFKCMDIVESGIQNFNHVAIHTTAVRLGYDPVDLFILARNKRPMVGWNQHVQFHARKDHSFVWIFRKP